MARGLTIHNLHKSFGSTIALEQVSFEIHRKEIVAVLGPSGCGKSTLLAVIAGLEKQDLGEIRWDGESIDHLPPHQRGFGLMFQDLVLFPHRNVFDNIAFGLQIAHEPKTRITQRVRETLALVGLPGFEKRDVHTLSGGESQRIALARSLAPRPRLLMLDEPLSSLDRNLRERLVTELRSILRQSHQTAIYVTHDQEEAFAIADRIVIMKNGRIQQTGTPQDLYRHPASPFVASFLGMTNLVPGHIRGTQDGKEVVSNIGTFPTASPLEGEVTILLRPDAITLNRGGDASISGELNQVIFRGNQNHIQVHVNGHTLSFRIPAHLPLPSTGETVQVGFDSQDAIQIFPAQKENTANTIE